MSTDPTRMTRQTRRRRNSFGTVIPYVTAAGTMYKVRWWTPGGRRQRAGFATKREATNELARIQLGHVTTPAEPAPAPPSTTFGDVGSSWLELHSAKLLRSHRSNQYRWDLHVKPRMGTLPLPEVTPQRLLTFRAEIMGTGVKSPTVNRVLALVRTVLRFAVATGHLAASPIEKLARGAYLLPVEKKRIEPPIKNPADVGRLLETIAGKFPRLHALYATAVFCGLRKGELCGLHWEDVHLEERYILVKRSFDGLTKSARWRTVPIPAQLVPILAAHRLADQFKCHLAFPDDGGRMFTTHARLQDRLAEALSATGLGNKMRLHDLRHEYASMYLAFGGNISDLQKNLGHSSVTVTEAYIHSGEARRIDEAQRVRFEAPPTATVSDIHQG